MTMKDIHHRRHLRYEKDLHIFEEGAGNNDLFNKCLSASRAFSYTHMIPARLFSFLKSLVQVSFFHNKHMKYL